MTSIITYRNPLEQWFWEGGYTYVGTAVIAFAAVYFVGMWWVERKDKAERKKRWLKMNETQRASWRYFNRRNGYEAESWEKEATK